MVAAAVVRGLVANMQAQDPYTLEVTQQETDAQIKYHVSSLHGIVPKDQVGFLAQDEATLDQCDLEAPTTQEVAGRKLRRKVYGSLAPKVRGQIPKVAKQEKKKKTDWSDGGMQFKLDVTGTALLMLCPPLGRRRAPMPIPKSYCHPAVLIKLLCPEKKIFLSAIRYSGSISPIIPALKKKKKKERENDYESRLVWNM